MQLSTKIALSFIVLVALTTGILLVIIGFERQSLGKSLSGELKEQIRHRTTEILKPVYKLCELKESQSLPLLQNDLKNTYQSISRMGGISLANDSVPWELSSNGDNRIIELPMMLIGKEWLGKNRDLEVASPIVDEIRELSGAHSSILQRVNKKGDLVNVCTSKLSQSGQRAIGSYVSHLNQDGTPNKLIETILSGKQYRERASYANNWTTLTCEPIRSVVTGRIIGALSVSLSHKDTVESIRKIILKTAIGKSGYMWVLGSKGERRGTYIISKDGLRDGENLWDFQDDNGEYFIRSIVHLALHTKNGQAQFYRYPWKNSADSQPRMKIAAFTYFEQWDWIIGSSAYEDDFQETQIRVGKTLSHMFWVTLLAGLALTSFSILAGFFVHKTIRSFTEERELNNWLKSSLNELSEKLRGDQEVYSLVTYSINQLATSLRVESGVLYLRQVPDMLNCVATYGISDPEKNVPPVKLGKGPVGQAALKEKVIVIKETTEADAMLPRKTIIKSLMHENEVMGLIQFSSATPFHDIHNYFLNQAAESIAIAIGTAQSRSKVNDLLIKTQKQAQELEKISNYKSDFLANMSHELRTPLNAILGFSQIMKRSSTISPEEQKNLDIILSSGNHLLNLINQVLELAKIEAGHQKVVLKTFHLPQMIHNIADLFRLRAEQKRLSFVIDLESNVPDYVRCDEQKLRQVLINLLSNALKFTDKGKFSLYISAAYPKNDREKGNDCQLSFKVEDSGVGIAAEELGNVYQMFTQTTSGLDSGEGTGLGIPISYKYVHLMGGELTVSSEEGQWTVFQFEIPCQVMDSGDLAKDITPRRVIGLKAGQPSFRLLVVEDNENNRILLVRLLQTVGFEVREAVNGREAVEIWGKWQPHLIWMDIRMPLMDGYEATKMIKSKIVNGSKIDTKIIAMTASAFEEDKLKMIEHGGNDFVRKPFKEADIFEIMRKYLGVNYVYEAKEKDCQAAHSGKVMSRDSLTAALNNLPKEVLGKLEEATELSDIAMIDQLIEEIRPENDQLADTLSELADNFSYDRILACLQKTGVIDLG